MIFQSAHFPTSVAGPQSGLADFVASYRRSVPLTTMSTAHISHLRWAVAGSRYEIVGRLDIGYRLIVVDVTGAIEEVELVENG